MVVDSEVDAGRFRVPGGPPGSLGANVRFLSQSDQGGRPGGLQIMVTHGHAFIGQSDGVTVVDVQDPRRPRAVCRIPAPSGSWTPHLQTHGDLLLVAEELNFYHHQPDEADYYMHSIPGLHPGMFGQRGTDFGAGMSVYDISVPELPRKIGSLAVEGFGLKRLWYDGGRYAYASAIMDGFIDHILVVIDMDVPSRPELVGQWWLPGMWAAGGEVPTWSNRVALHHALVADGYAYGAWRDGGLTVLDLADPTRPTLTRHLNWCPPFGGAPTARCRSLIGTCSWWGTRPFSTTARTGSSASGYLTFDARPVRCRSPPSRVRENRIIPTSVGTSGRTTCTRTGSGATRARRRSLLPIRTPGSGCSISMTPSNPGRRHSSFPPRPTTWSRRARVAHSWLIPPTSSSIRTA
jgi:hypothetical protein